MTGVSVVGLGKLGACIAACLASKGFTVIGVDANSHTVNLINQGRAPVVEPGLNELIAANCDRLVATIDCEAAVLESDLTFIVVPTPSEDHGGFSLRYVIPVARAIGRALRRKDDYHIVALTSTVLPGSTQFAVLPVLEREAEKACGSAFALCYNPAFVALGNVIHDLMNPDFVLFGECDERAGNKLEAFYKVICGNSPSIARMNFVNAELTKIAVNTFLTMKIAFANMVSELCEQLPGGDVDVVTGALGLDSRIGKRYLKGGLGYGGPCFPRDNVALAFLARQLNRQAVLAESTDRFNRQVAESLIGKIQRYLRPGSAVAVLGLSYKPLSNVVEESQGLYLADRLAANGVSVVVYDPIAMENARDVLGGRVRYAGSVWEALAESDVVVVANPDPAFLSIRPIDFPQRATPITVIDCWRALVDAFSTAPNVEYVPLGIGSHDTAFINRLAEIWSGRAGTEPPCPPASLQQEAVPRAP